MQYLWFHISVCTSSTYSSRIARCLRGLIFSSWLALISSKKNDNKPLISSKENTPRNDRAIPKFFLLLKIFVNGIIKDAPKRTGNLMFDLGSLPILFGMRLLILFETPFDTDYSICFLDIFLML